MAFFERKKKKSISISNCDTRYLCSFSATMQWFVHEKISALQEKSPPVEKKLKNEKKIVKLPRVRSIPNDHVTT